jgi:TolB protein
MNQRSMPHALALLAFVLLSAVSNVRSAENGKLVITEYKDALGFLKPVPVNVSGFTGEADAVLKSDLLFMGVQHVPVADAQYLVTGSNAGRVEGRLADKVTKQFLLNKAYNGGSQRQQIHALADDIAKALTGLRGIAQTKIAFKVEKGRGHGEIYISDYDGHGAQAITSDNAIVAGPEWRGSDMLLYTSYKLGNPNIFSHHLTTGARTAVARHPGGNYSPAVSPDGSRVTMILSKGGSPDLYVANIDGSGLKQLTKTREAEFSPCWSPDGKTICFGSRERGATLLFTIPASGGTTRQLATIGASSPTEPDWSPDGKWIAFTSQVKSGFNICIVQANGGRGGDAIVLVDGEDPSWAPNSRTLMFCRGRDHAKQLSILDVPTKQVKTLGRISESNSQPSWAK